MAYATLREKGANTVRFVCRISPYGIYIRYKTVKFYPGHICI